MSRFPFKTRANFCLETKRLGSYGDITIEKLEDRHNRIYRDFMMLQSEGFRINKKLHRLSTINPQKMLISDVYLYLTYRQSLRHEDGSPYTAKEHLHDIRVLTYLVEFPVVKVTSRLVNGKEIVKEDVVKSSAVTNCLMIYPYLIPRGYRKRKSPLKQSTVDAIFSKASSVDPGDFYQVRAYALVCLLCVVPERTQETMYVDFEDLDFDKWELTINHPKGEQSYGDVRCISIHPDARSILMLYRDALILWKNKYSVTSPALFPSWRSADGYLSDNAIRDIVKFVERDIGNLERIYPQACRRTAIQDPIDDGVSSDTMAVISGNSPETIYRHYARRSQHVANAEFKNSWGVED